MRLHEVAFAIGSGYAIFLSLFMCEGLLVKLIVVSALIVFGLGGCYAGLPAPPVATPVVHVPSSPHLVEDEARARLAFLEFRLLVADGRWQGALTAMQRARYFDPDSTYLHLLLARVYLHLEQPEAAIALIEELLAIEPENFEAHLLLGDIHLSRQRSEQALAQFRRALALRGDDEGAHLRLAMVLLQQGQEGRAVATLEEFLQQRPAAHGARLSLARIYRDEMRYDAAQEVYRRYLEYFPQNQQILVELGQLLEQRDPDAALTLYHQALAADPGAVLVRQQLAQLYLDRQQPAEALEQLQLVRRLSPFFSDDFQIGLLLLRLERWEAAEREFRALLRQRDTAGATDRYRYYLAMSLIGRQHYREAMELLRSIGPEAGLYPEAMLQLSYLYQQQQQGTQALTLLEDLLQDNYHQPEVYYYLAAFHQDLGQTRQAYEVARTATERYPDNPRLLYQLGVLLSALDHQEQAFTVMTRVLDMDDQHADALNYLAYVQAEEESDLPLALERARRALALKPAGYIEDTLGWVYFKMGCFEESRVHLENANRLQPDDLIVLEHLGDVYQELGMYRDAARAYQRILELDADARGVSVKLESLRQRGFL